MYDLITDSLLNGNDFYKKNITGDKTFKWYYCEHIKNTLPDQGWKIHISANLSNSAEILKTTIPYLISKNLTFKHPQKQEHLSFINSGKGGITQVGKFITIYFTDENEFKLHINPICKLFKHFLAVPFIITDKRFCINLPVFYRYGAILSKEVQNDYGVFESTIMDSEGNPQTDHRESSFILPKGIEDPFKSFGSINTDFDNQYLADKYVTIKKLTDSYKTETYLGLNLTEGNHCFIKIAKSDIEIENEIYSSDLVSNESKMIALLKDDSFPSLVDVFLENNKKVLVTTLCEGVNLFDFISMNTVQGLTLTKKQVKTLFISLLMNVDKLEKLGIIHNDLKPSNILIDKKFRTYVIDFETSYFNTKNNIQKSSIKTRGFNNNQHPNSNPDYYSLGMVLYFVLTGYNISDAPRENNILERPTHYLSGILIPGIDNFIAKLCNDEYKSIASIIQDFEVIFNKNFRTFNIKKNTISKIAKSYGKISSNITHWLFNNSFKRNRTTIWNSSHVFNAGFGRMDINIGSAGILMYLSYFHFSNGKNQNQYSKKIKKATDFLIESKKGITGLFVGESGKVLSILLSLISIKKFNINLIDDRIIFIENNLPKNDDFFNGKSGVGYLFLSLYVITNNTCYLKKAISVSEKIINNSVEIDEFIYWKDFHTDKKYLGFAHGISGIGYFLILLYQFTADKNLLLKCEKIAATLLSNAFEYSGYRNLINWPNEPNQMITNNHWCNGTSGIANFFLELYKVTGKTIHLDVLKKCTNTIIKSSATMNPTMCHGLAGNINFLINYYQLSNDIKVKLEIFRLSEVLKMAGLVSDNYLLFPSESPYVITPDLWVGFSGTAYVFQRLTDIDKNLDFLSLDYFRTVGNYQFKPSN